MGELYARHSKECLVRVKQSYLTGGRTAQHRLIEDDGLSFWTPLWCMKAEGDLDGGFLVVVLFNCKCQQARTLNKSHHRKRAARVRGNGAIDIHDQIRTSGDSAYWIA